MKPVWAAACGMVLGLAVASAQPVISAKSGTIALAEGEVYLNDQALNPRPGQFPDIKENGVVRTADGRAEVLLTPGVLLRLGDHSSLKLITNRLIDTRLELLSGSAVIEADDLGKDNHVTLVCKDSTVSINKAPGIYRFDASPAELKVFKGSADAQVADQHVEVGAGRMLALAAGSDTIERFDTKDTDGLDNWSTRRGQQMAIANVSAAKYANDSWWTSGLMGPCSGFGYGLGYGSGMGFGYGMGYAAPMGAWAWNPWFGMATYVPCSGVLWSPYGYRFWSPLMVGTAFYAPWSYYGSGNGGRVYRGLSGGGSGNSGLAPATAGSRSYAGVASRGYTSATSNSGFPSSGSGSGGFGGGMSSGGMGGGIGSAASGHGGSDGGHAGGGGAGGRGR